MTEFKTRVFQDGVEICGVIDFNPSGELVVPRTLPVKNDADRKAIGVEKET